MMAINKLIELGVSPLVVKWIADFLTEQVYFGRQDPPEATYNISDVHLPNVTSVKLLGVILQSNLKWDGHIADILTKANLKWSISFLHMNLRYFIAVWIVASSVTPPWFISLLLTLSTPISASGMIIQILAIYRIKDSGSVSFSSWFISWATGFLRLVTSIIAGDMLVVFSYVFTNSLRAVGCIVILYYQPSAKKLT
ncbi:uncharacterized protein LOC110988593 isoform X2 [Acanthaster planci]|uniref:Uncharacterized protein LOC110988593 isoform X2 n=1 Tax=Acanthaster planci TaxID=133434 RepID=A0A8B7ZWR1_ACAPL|nr:uncharacterized protein LOC110988593 isoform X2 [Acanthaster planci]